MSAKYIPVLTILLQYCKAENLIDKIAIYEYIAKVFYMEQNTSDNVTV